MTFSKQCKNCKADKLQWRKTLQGWRLYSKDGNIHMCYRKTSTTVETQEPALMFKGMVFQHVAYEDEHSFFIVRKAGVELGRVLHCPVGKIFKFFENKPVDNSTSKDVEWACSVINHVVRK